LALERREGSAIRMTRTGERYRDADRH